MATAPTSHADDEQAFAGDEPSFRERVKKHMDTLLKAARHDLGYYVKQGYIHKRDFTPEEAVGEGLIQAWAQREKRPASMSLRGWLLGTQHKALVGLVKRQRAYRRDKALSLDAPVPQGEATQATQEVFWEFYQPDRFLTWEDVTPANEPVDVEIALDPEAQAILADDDARHVLMLHDAFEMSLPEIAYTLNRSVVEVNEMLSQARAALRERMITQKPPQPDVQPPAPSQPE